PAPPPALTSPPPFVQSSGHPPALPSFPTRRSSDLTIPSSVQATAVLPSVYLLGSLKICTGFQFLPLSLLTNTSLPDGDQAHRISFLPILVNGPSGSPGKGCSFLWRVTG